MSHPCLTVCHRHLGKCFSNEFCRTRIAVCGFSLQAVLPSTHPHLWIRSTDERHSSAEQDKSFLPLERTRHLRHRNKVARQGISFLEVSTSNPSLKTSSAWLHIQHRLLSFLWIYLCLPPSLLTQRFHRHSSLTIRPLPVRSFWTCIGSYVVLTAPSRADEGSSPIWAIGIIQSYVLHLLSKLVRKTISTNHVNNQLFQMNFSPKSHHISLAQR